MKSVIVILVLTLVPAAISAQLLWNPYPTTLSGFTDVRSNGAAPQYLSLDLRSTSFHAVFLETDSAGGDSTARIGYALSSNGTSWSGSGMISPPPAITGFPALDIWRGSPAVAFNTAVGDTVAITVAVSPPAFTRIPLARMGVPDEPRDPRIATTANGKLAVVGERPLSGSVHLALLDTLNQSGWSDPLPHIRYGDQYVVVANDSGRLAVVWSGSDTVGFVESFDNGETFTSPAIVFGSQIISGDLVRPGKGLDAVYIGSALEIVWSAVGSTPRSARIYSWNPLGGMVVVADSSLIHDTLAVSMHSGDDHLLIDRPSVGRYQGSQSVGIAFVVFTKSNVDSAGWNYGEIYGASGALNSTSFYSVNLTDSRFEDDRYPKVASVNFTASGLFEVAYQSDSVGGPNAVRGVESRARQITRLFGVIDLSVDETGALPRETRLFQNYPNPFNPRTTLRYTIAHNSHVRLAVYDVLGREVALLVDRDQSPGTREVGWDAAGVPSGIYFYRIQAKDEVQVRKMVVVK